MLVFNKENVMSQAHPIFGEVISVYSRAQALEDGVLVDVTETAKEAGFKFPVAVTASVWSDLHEGLSLPSAAGQTVSGRIWDVVWMAMLAIRAAKRGDRLTFKVIIGRKTHSYLMVCGPGDTPAPVITIMRPEDD